MSFTSVNRPPMNVHTSDGGPLPICDNPPSNDTEESGGGCGRQYPKSSRLKLLRRSKGLTLEDLSELTGISPSYLSRLEAGARRLNADLLGTLSAVLGCQPGDLLPRIGMDGASIRLPNLPGEAMVSVVGRSDQKTSLARTSSSQRDLKAFLPPKDLPVYNMHSTGSGVSSSDAGGEAPSIDLTNPTRWTMRPPQLLGVRTAFALQVCDEENAPKYAPGDLLFVHPTHPLTLRCSVLVITKDDRIIVRQFLGWVADSILIAPFALNTQCEVNVRSLPRDTLRAVYKIVGTLEGDLT